VLLGGYLYAHLSIRFLPPRLQSWVHAGLLLLAATMLPITPDPRWKPAAGDDPALRIVLLLAATVGLGHLLLSATGPLLQSWYVREREEGFPVRFYALSNLGSMLALFAYPLAIEPSLSLRHQSFAWSAGFIVFALLCGTVALRRRNDAGETRGARESTAPLDGRRVTWWFTLSAASSGLLVAVTNHLCQNVAAIPLLWVLPLALYLLSFIVTFDRPGFYRHQVWLWLHGAALAAMAYATVRVEGVASLRVQIPLFALTLFVCCVFLHGELVRRRPAVEHLTLFYLMISAGGAAGGALVALGAPRCLSGYFELPIAIAFCGAIALFMVYGRDWRSDVAWVAIMISLVVAARYWTGSISAGSRELVRNFYGGLRIVDKDTGDPERAMRMQVHGVIKHGEQFLHPDKRRWPTSYYGEQSGAAVAFRHSRRSPLRAGIIGLGAGTLATYGQPGDVFRFYEINPEVIRQARQQFTFLADSQARIEVVPGDARLQLEQEQPQNFDVLVVDAFSGDSVPVHLLTREAFEIYFRHLHPGGVLALHLSNVYMNLPPVAFTIADSLGVESRLVTTRDDPERGAGAATWVLVTANHEFLKRSGLEQDTRPQVRAPLWTDDYSSPWKLIE
jgi:hypothetical protein